MTGAVILGSHAMRMDGIYRTQRHFYDLTRKYYLLGRDRLIEGLDATPGMEVLEVGCGTGRNLVRAAQHWQGVYFTGLDISAAMLETASVSVMREGLIEQIALHQADAAAFTTIPYFTERKFDRIFLSYTLSMIPPWELALEEAAGALAKGGSLHIVDFGQQEKLPGWFRAMLFAWLRHFHVSPRASLRAVLEDLADRHDLRLRFRPLYRGYAWEAVLSAA